MVYSTRAPGIESYKQYLTHVQPSPLQAHVSTLINITPQQQIKLQLHECCAHEGFTNLNHWIRQGYFKHIDKSIANIPDLICTICPFSKAHRRSHLSHTGHIGSNHREPGHGVSADGMEAGTPGRLFTT
jgi:hypothetical protein